MTISRTQGQTPLLPGSTSIAGLVFTSGLVAPSALTDHPGDSVAQIADALAELRRVLAEADSDTGNVLRLECFLADAADFAEWNRQYLQVWPDPGPARTTLVSKFANSSILVEIQVIAARRTSS
ncbi:MAG: RidA family protein [Actinomycetota bacterium]